MTPDPGLARWLLAHRDAIDTSLATRLGAAAPRASGPEAETLRRFRTFASTALMRGQVHPPALDGLRPEERRVMSLLGAWKETASELAGEAGPDLELALDPLLAEFRLALRTSSGGRRQRSKTGAPRRAVTGAIDRVADSYLAIDVSAATIVDANPALGALLGVDRDSLFGLDALGFIPKEDHAEWWSHLDALAESHESLAFEARLKDVGGHEIPVSASARAATARGHTLALVMLRPGPGRAHDAARDIVEPARRPGPEQDPAGPSPLNPSEPT
ncbi:MAG: PAS domain-containing protein [Myxococcota bacterium]|nr:PAS domain-containing protein [Myxococcota bacterium]